MANIFTGKQERGFGENLSQLDALGLLANSWEAARDEYLGIDDFRRAFTKAREGDIKGTVKSALTGAAELGTSMIPGIGAARLARLPAGKLGRGLLRLFGAGAKTPARGVAVNVAAPAAVMGAAGLAAPKLPVIGGMFRGSPETIGQPTNINYNPYVGVDYLSQGSPVAANREALLQLMRQGAF